MRKGTCEWCQCPYWVTECEHCGMTVCGYCSGKHRCREIGTDNCARCGAKLPKMTEPHECDSVPNDVTLAARELAREMLKDIIGKSPIAGCFHTGGIVKGPISVDLDDHAQDVLGYYRAMMEKSLRRGLRRGLMRTMWFFDLERIGELPAAGGGIVERRND